MHDTVKVLLVGEILTNVRLLGRVNTSAHGRFYEKIFGEPGPSSFGRQQRLSEITMKPITFYIKHVEKLDPNYLKKI